MSDSNRVSLSYAREAAFKVSNPVVNADAGAGTNILTQCRFNKSSLKHRKDTIQTEEIDATRQIKEMIEVGIGAVGTTEHELTLKNLDDLVCAIMQGDEFAAVSVSCNVVKVGQYITPASGTPFGPLLMAKFVRVSGAGTSANNGIKMLVAGSTTGQLFFAPGSFTANESAVTLTFYTNFVTVIETYTGTFSVSESIIDGHLEGDFGGISAGTITAAMEGARYLKVSGLIEAANNGLFPVASISSSAGIISWKNNAAVADAATTVTVQAVYVRTGTKLQSHLIQENYLDNGKSIIYTGMCADTMDLKLEAKGKAMVTLGYVGYEGVPRTYATNSAAAAQQILTSDNTNVADAATVTIDTKVYTFKTALTPLEGEVLIGGNADASLLNLIRAINHTGTPNTDYKCAAVHPTVSAAASVVAHSITVTALTGGTAGNAIATTETSIHLSWGGATLKGGAAALQDAFGTHPVSGSSNIGSITDGAGTAFTNPVKSIGVKINNNLRERPVLAQKGTLVPGSGDSQVTGTLNAYFTDNAELNAYKNHAERAIEFPFVDVDGNVMNYYLPRTQYTDGSPQVSGKNSDVMQDLPFQALRHVTLGYTLQIDMLAA